MSRARMDTASFIKKANDVHDFKFSYTRAVYVSSTTKIIITCPIHGDFEQNPGNHLFGSGCKSCANAATADKQRHTSSTFIKRAVAVHAQRYGYSEVDYKGLFEKVVITCKTHGNFRQQPSNHLRGHGCPKCKAQQHVEERLLDHDEFVARSNDKHDNFYSYPDRYVSGRTPMCIVCPDHGEFVQLPYQHLQGSGCTACSNRRSRIEQRVALFVEQHTEHEVVLGSRSVIAPYELDIYVPQLKLAIEVNGNYWHSEKRKHETAHYDKVKLCASKRIRLLQFWESDIKKNNKIVASVIANALGKSKVVYARKTRVVELSAAQARQFQDKTHLQGFASASVYYGLVYERKLVACMSFGHARFTKHCDWELVRFSSALGTVVIGAASKLFTHFTRLHPTSSIVSYADLMISKGDIYRTLGFTRSHTSKPNYKWTRRNVVLARYQTQKHKLAKVLGSEFNNNESESVNMRRCGFAKIHDAGNLVFIYNAKDAQCSHGIK